MEVGLLFLFHETTTCLDRFATTFGFYLSITHPQEVAGARSTCQPHIHRKWLVLVQLCIYLSPVLHPCMFPNEECQRYSDTILSRVICCSRVIGEQYLNQLLPSKWHTLFFRHQLLQCTLQSWWRQNQNSNHCSICFESKTYTYCFVLRG